MGFGFKGNYKFTKNSLENPSISILYLILSQFWFKNVNALTVFAFSH